MLDSAKIKLDHEEIKLDHEEIKLDHEEIKLDHGEIEREDNEPRLDSEGSLINAFMSPTLLSSTHLKHHKKSNNQE